MCLRTITSFILVVTVASIQFPIDLPEGTNLTEAVANTIFGNRGPVKHFEARSHAEISSVDGCKVIRVYLPVTKVRNHIAGVSFEKPLSQTGWGRTIMFQGKFSPGFQFGESGELFGLCAGDCNDPHDFNAILRYPLKIEILVMNAKYKSNISVGTKIKHWTSIVLTKSHHHLLLHHFHHHQHLFHHHHQNLCLINGLQ